MSMIKQLNKLDSIRKYTESIIREEISLKDQLDSLIMKNDETEKDIIAAKEGQSILRTVARETQSIIEDHLSNIVTLALSSVEVNDKRVPKPPKFIARMVERRGVTECDLLFKEGEREQYPLECSGYGYVDIADYILRVGYILLEDEYCDYGVRKTLLSDEPFRNVDPLLQYKVSEMLLMISNDLGFQQILVSHAEGVNIKAESTFNVIKESGISRVTKNDKI